MQYLTTQRDKIYNFKYIYREIKIKEKIREQKIYIESKIRKMMTYIIYIIIQ